METETVETQVQTKTQPEQILDLLGEKQPLIAHEISDILGAAHSSIAGVLSRLVASHKVGRRKADGNQFYYFLPSFAPDAGEEIFEPIYHRRARPTHHSTTQTLLRYIQANPGLLSSEIRAAFPQTPSGTISSRLFFLKHTGQIKTTQTGGAGTHSFRYWAADADTPVDEPVVQAVRRRQPLVLERGTPPASSQLDSLATLAYKFYWETQSDSLREFVTWTANHD